MRTVLKWIGIALGGIAALALLALAGVYIGSQILLDRTYKPGTGSLRAAATPAGIARGAHLATVFHCSGCHGKDLEGDLFFQGMGATLYAPNLRLFVHDSSDADFDHALRHGLRPDGTSLVAMPSQVLQYMHDDEAAAILGYLRSLPRAGAQLPAPSLGMFVRLGVLLGKFKSAVDSFADVHPPLDLGPRFAAGRHLAMVSCGQCHTPMLSGMNGSGGFKSPDLAITIAYDRNDFMKFMHTGKALGNRELPIMSVTARQNLSHFTDDELGAIYDYLIARGRKLSASRGK